MDLNSYKRKDTATVEIRDPFGQKTDITVEVYGRDSKQYRKVALELARDFDSSNEDDAADRGARLLQACIASWKNVEADGKPVEADSEQAREILKSDEMDWFASQINRAIQDRSLFFSKSGKS